ncbi:MAG: hypothetical protein LUI07_04845 [Lachnospiraceae bacterium]|nr:hypothetical protein [Lachnospiraceae bacterium]
MAEKRTRRSKREMLVDKLESFDTKIKDLEDKIKTLEEQRDEIQFEIDEIDEAAAKAAEEKALQEVLALMKEKGISASELKATIEKQ